FLQMKKSLIALAVLGASSVAFAASNVTLYGVVDGGVVVSKAKKADGTVVRASSGFDSGPRWGLKGVEDLGNGYSVGFQLEQGFNLDTGTTANGWQNKDGDTGTFNRESRLYVQGGFGTLSFGRFGSLASGAGSQTILTGWQFGTSYEDTGSWTKYGKGNSRINNAISYVSPAFGGVTLHAMYSNGTQKDDERWSDNHHYYGLGLKAKAGAFDGVVIFEATDAKGTDSVKGTAYKNPAYSVTAGGNYNLGVATLSAIYQYAWSSDTYKQNAFGLSTAVPAFGGTAKLGTKFVFGKDEAKAAGEEDKYNGWSINAAYSYPLSKRTYAYGYAGYTHGGKLWKAETAKEADLSHTGYAVAMGLVHKF
ncbi:porin, partial [Turicimonas muris]|uniref:porin n=2 Tax=Turicimonas muris TaxID=1796652 RepID=UPI0026756FB6